MALPLQGPSSVRCCSCALQFKWLFPVPSDANFILVRVERITATQVYQVC